MKRTLTTLLLLVLAACGGDGGDGVTNNAGTIQLGSTTYDVTEGAVINILVTRSGGNSGIASAYYSTSDGTALAGTDYQATSGTLTFADGVSGIQEISIPIYDDPTVEVVEAFTLTLSNVSGATLGVNSSATVNIVNVSAGLPIMDDHARGITEEVLQAATWPFDVIDLLDLIGLPVIVNVAPDAPASGVVSRRRMAATAPDEWPMSTVDSSQPREDSMNGSQIAPARRVAPRCGERAAGRRPDAPAWRGEDRAWS